MNFPFFQGYVQPRSQGRSFWHMAEAEPQDGQRAECREETVAEQGVSFCEIFLPVIKNVFAKFDKRLG